MDDVHITAEGDTFDLLALEYYDDEKQASAIMAANPEYYSTLVFEAGTALIIPLAAVLTMPETLPPWRRKV